MGAPTRPRGKAYAVRVSARPVWQPNLSGARKIEQATEGEDRSAGTHPVPVEPPGSSLDRRS
ncbi:hypothetical protein GS506_07710 [Rhodococcus hoagii]|nr:hypothetical protein [Prescottella equi]